LSAPRRQLGIDARIERRPGGAVLGLGRTDVGFGRTQVGAGGKQLLARNVQALRQWVGHAEEAGRHLQVDRLLPHHAEVVDLRVGEVGLFGAQVVLRQGQPGLGLVQVHQPSHAAFAAQRNLLEDALVVGQVDLGQPHQFLPLEHVEVDLDHAQPDAFGAAQQFVGTRIDRGPLAGDLAAGGETVEQHLLELQAGFAARQRHVVVPFGGAGAGVVAALAAAAGQQIDLGQVAGASRLQLLVHRQARVDAGLDFGMRVERALHGFGERLCLHGGRQRQDQGNDKGSGGGKKTHAGNSINAPLSLCASSALEKRRDRQ
jgi:hypothetical protein